MDRLDISIKFSLYTILCALVACKMGEGSDKYLELEVADGYVVLIPDHDQYNFVEEDSGLFRGHLLYDSIHDLRIMVSSGRRYPFAKDLSDSNRFELDYYHIRGECNYLGNRIRPKIPYQLDHNKFTSKYLDYDLGPGNELRLKEFKCSFINDSISINCIIRAPVDTFDLLADWEWANQFKNTQIIKKAELSN